MRPPKEKYPQQIDQNIFKQIFLDHWENFKEAKPLYNCDQYESPVQKMLGCREEFGGYSEYLCMHCGKDRKRVPFSCKSCFCLSCSKAYTDNFVSQVSEVLHDGVSYRHIVLTLPEQLRLAFYRERRKKDLLSSFMKCGYSCLEDVMSYVAGTKIKIGCIIVIQTHGRSGEYNPHLHVIMTSGGVVLDQSKWWNLGYFKYSIIHRKWQYHLLNFVKEYFRTKEISSLVDSLWNKYPKGFVANVSKGKAPETFSGLSRYLAKYVASPPIAVRRIINYDSKTVTYWYNDHETKARKTETVDVFTFIGRMVQHIMPKWFQRVRYYGLEASKTFKKWSKVIQEGIKKIKGLVKGVYQVIKRKTYRQRYREMSGKDPMICSHCGHIMELYQIWHPKYGVLYDELENIKGGKYEQPEKIDRGGGHPIRPPAKGVQLPLFQM